MLETAGRRGQYANGGCAFLMPRAAVWGGSAITLHLLWPHYAPASPSISVLPRPPAPCLSPSTSPPTPTKPSCFILPPVLLRYYTPPSPTSSRNMRCICFPPPPGPREWGARREKSADASLCRGGGCNYNVPRSPRKLQTNV